MEMPVSELTGLTLKDLIDSGLHFGHQTKRWNPKMRDYIFDKRNGIHIIDLTQTVPMIETAAKFLRDTVLSGKKILFVATKKQAQETVKQAAESCGQHFMTERWLGGTLTNNQTIRNSVKRMRQIETMGRNNNGVLSVHKKEASSLRRELDKLQRNLGGIADMTRMPGAIFIIDICREQNALNEAKRLNIPVVALVDTNADPDPIDYVIPGNDDAVRGIKLIADAFARVIKAANDEYSQIAAEKQRLKEAERAKEEAANRAARKARKETASDKSDEAKAKLTESRKRAAKAAKEAVEAKVAAVETVKADSPKAEGPETEETEVKQSAPETEEKPVVETEANTAAEAAEETKPAVKPEITEEPEASEEDETSEETEADDAAADEEKPARKKTAAKKTTTKKTTRKPAADKKDDEVKDEAPAQEEATAEEPVAAETAEDKPAEETAEDKPAE